MLILAQIGVVESKTYVKQRKIFIIVALIVAAVITPTQDAFNLALATAPILALYEIGIIISRIAERRKARDLAG
jgi:sec-independent protein translocase protein TatC